MHAKHFVTSSSELFCVSLVNKNPSYTCIRYIYNTRKDRDGLQTTKLKCSSKTFSEDVSNLSLGLYYYGIQSYVQLQFTVQLTSARVYVNVCR